MNKSDEDFIDTLILKLEENRGISAETHKEHHRFVDTMIIKNEKRIQTWDAVKLHIMKFGFLSVFSFLAVAAYYFIKEHFK